VQKAIFRPSASDGSDANHFRLTATAAGVDVADLRRGGLRAILKHAAPQKVGARGKLMIPHNREAVSVVFIVCQ
jgi:hypothetical protein